MAEVVAAEALQSFIGRIERLNAEISELNADKSEVYSEAKALGFDVKIMKECVRLRKMETADRRERDELLDLYMGALEGGTTVAHTRVRAHGVATADDGTKYEAGTGEVVAERAA